MLKSLYLIVFSVLLSSCTLINNKSNYFFNNTEPSRAQTDSIEYYNLQEKATTCKAFCQEQGYNSGFCLIINLAKHSGKKRFYLWDFDRGIAVDSGMVSHGCYKYPWGLSMSKERAICSNQEDSHTSSLGNYKIGERGISDWGIKIKYTLHGLDKSNSNAQKRFIVLHSWDDVSEAEVYPSGTPEGWGCPATSNEFLTRIDKRLRSSKKPVLLCIFQ